MSPAAILYVGLDREKARIEMFKALSVEGHIVSTEDLVHNVGRSERTGVVVEPRLSLQWFVDMQQLATPALRAVMDGEIDFYPDNLKNTYRHWMENIRDWCISRQLWWGHQIPAWYMIHDGEEIVIVAKTETEAVEQARKLTGRGELTASSLRRDEDVLDTWFSSWLWPISVFDGWKNEKELNYYYPTSVIVTGWGYYLFVGGGMVMAGLNGRYKKAISSCLLHRNGER
jgi:valyl-tRNA synthetase